ncbi:MAG: hypothetical protein HN377_09165 [Alphaproteobacteria bacterium]|jgi:hypothetical protein|nr:hypothetical protein [Alphaproteobacteria bacterium]
MVESILSPNSYDIANARRVLNSAAVGLSAFARQEKVIRSGQQSPVEIVNERTSKPRESDEDLNKIISFLSNTVDRIKTIRKLADDLFGEVIKADSFQSGDNAVQFDVTLAHLSRVAAQTYDTPNLLNSSSDEDFVFLTTEDGRVVTLSGAALGSDYAITQTKGTLTTGSFSHGNIDYPENGTVTYTDHDVGVLRQQDPLKGAFTTPLAGNYTAISKDVQLDSIDKFDPNIVTITFFPGTSAAETITGTLSRGGIGVLDSFLYDGFTTAAGRNRAFEDLEKAKGIIDAELARFEGALDSARLISGQRDLSLTSFVSLLDSSTNASVIELHAADNARAFQNNFDAKLSSGVESARNQLSKVLGGLNLNPPTNSVVDIQA